MTLNTIQMPYSFQNFLFHHGQNFGTILPGYLRQPSSVIFNLPQSSLPGLQPVQNAAARSTGDSRTFLTYLTVSASLILELV